MKTFVIEEPSAAVSQQVDRWSPIPPNGQRCQFTGLKHAKLYHLLSGDGHARKRVRVVSLRTPGAKRGQTLFRVGDMLQYLDELAREQGESVTGEVSSLVDQLSDNPAARMTAQEIAQRVQQAQQQRTAGQAVAA
jgi:hypothetical protein